MYPLFRFGLLFSLVLLAVFSAPAQNLVTNGGFEEVGIGRVIGWDQPKGEYFHVSLTSFRNFNKINGLCFTSDDGNEYLQTKLKAPLIRGKKYHLSLWMLPGDPNLDQLGILFSPKPYEIRNRMNITRTPQVTFNLLPGNAHKWTELSIEYRANGTEQYMIIGSYSHSLDTSNVHRLFVVVTEARAETDRRVKSIRDSFNALYPVWSTVQEKRASKKEKEDFNRKVNDIQLAEKLAIDRAEEHFRQVSDSIEVLASGGLGYHYRPFFDNVCLALIKDDGTYSCTDPQAGKLKDSDRLVLNNLIFETDKAVIQSFSFPELDMLVDYLKDKPDLKIEISGYTDNTGTEEHNRSLSEARAAAVADYLTRKGIDPARVTWKGYGSSNPVASNDTEEGKQQNRRVEVEFMSGRKR